MTTGKSADQASPKASANTGERHGYQHEGTSDVADTKTSNSNDNESTINKEPEYGGPKGLEPTRYGDWEKNGRCSDF